MNPSYVVRRGLPGNWEYYHRGRYGEFKWTPDLVLASRFLVYEAAAALALRTIGGFVVSAPRETPQLLLPL